MLKLWQSHHVYLSANVTSTLGQGSKMARGAVLKLWQSHHMYLSVTVTATLVQGSKLARGAVLKLWQSHHMYMSVHVMSTLVQGNKLARGAVLKLWQSHQVPMQALDSDSYVSVSECDVDSCPRKHSGKRCRAEALGVASGADAGVRCQCRRQRRQYLLLVVPVDVVRDLQPMQLEAIVFQCEVLRHAAQVRDGDCLLDPLKVGGLGPLRNRIDVHKRLLQGAGVQVRS